MSGDEHFLSRWSRLKRESRDAAPEPAAVPAQSPLAEAPAAAPPLEPEPLPPVDSLTPESDFTGFMKPDVDPSLRNQALKALFRDPHFNEMDGLDVYIDDYGKADPLPEGWLEKLNQVARLGAYEPPKEDESADTPPAIAAASPVASDAGTSPEPPSDAAPDSPPSETS